MKRSRGGLVYSTGPGGKCPVCGWPADACACVKKGASTAPPTAKPGAVRVRRETKGRKGRGVTVIEGLSLAPADLADLAKQLKRRCGSGGTVKQGVIEIQGDHRDAVVEELVSRGFPAKRAGG